MRPHYGNRYYRLMCLGPALALVLSLCACSFAQPEGAVAGRPADYPDSSLRNATYVLGQPGQQPLRIKSQSIEIYQKAKVAYLEKISFEQENPDGTVSIRGTADRAQINMDSQDADISGNVFVEKVDDGMTIRCEALSWKDSLQLLETKDDGMVTVSYGNGNSMAGRGFTGRLDEALYEFSTIEKGYIQP
ncbi:MAG: LPS export ABC transporter periplasmic protein LptC [Sphaerochaetaceae bacterium]|nr:LPS export ABC transporter periplasmic protein LptC [Sphaerochaetaceae bacterium]